MTKKPVKRKPVQHKPDDEEDEPPIYDLVGKLRDQVRELEHTNQEFARRAARRTDQYKALLQVANLLLVVASNEIVRRDLDFTSRRSASVLANCLAGERGGRVATDALPVLKRGTGLMWLFKYWRATQRATDMSKLWPVCREEAADLDHARAAFYLHASNDTAWTKDYSEAELIEFVGQLK